MNVYARRIREVYPDLAVATIASVEGNGQNNDVTIVDDSAVFRFPRYPGGIDRLARVVRVLRTVGPRVSLAIPNPVWVSLEKPIPGQAFVGYPLVPGQPLWQTAFDAFDKGTKQSIADQLAGFLRSLHAIPPADVLPEEVATFDPRAVWADLYRRIGQKLFAQMRPDARVAVSQHFERFLNDPRVAEVRPVVIHGDFGSSNILHDPTSKRVTGVIDFDSAGLGDPATDLAAASRFGLSRLAREYPEVEACGERIEFYRGTFALQDALFGIENGDAAAFESGIAPYR